MSPEELLELIAERLPTDEEWFDHEADAIEWTDPKYHHQN